MCQYQILDEDTVMNQLGFLEQAVLGPIHVDDLYEPENFNKYLQ